MHASRVCLSQVPDQSFDLRCSRTVSLFTQRTALKMFNSTRSVSDAFLYLAKNRYLHFVLLQWVICYLNKTHARQTLKIKRKHRFFFDTHIFLRTSLCGLWTMRKVIFSFEMTKSIRFISPTSRVQRHGQRWQKPPPAEQSFCTVRAFKTLFKATRSGHCLCKHYITSA